MVFTTCDRPEHSDITGVVSLRDFQQFRTVQPKGFRWEWFRRSQ